MHSKLPETAAGSQCMKWQRIIRAVIMCSSFVGSSANMGVILYGGNMKVVTIAPPLFLLHTAGERPTVF